MKIVNGITGNTCSVNVIKKMFQKPSNKKKISWLSEKQYLPDKIIYIPARDGSRESTEIIAPFLTIVGVDSTFLSGVFF